MNRDQMAHRCPGAVVVETACLKEWEFRINERGVATILRSPDRLVHGVVWDISDDHRATLDIYEGVKQGIYDALMLEVIGSSGNATSALVYVDPVTAVGLPYPGYLEGVVVGARQHNLPTNYILEDLAAAQRGGTSEP